MLKVGVATVGSTLRDVLKLTEPTKLEFPASSDTTTAVK